MRIVGRKNYTEIIKLIDVSLLDDKIKKVKIYFDKITSKGTNWIEVDSDKVNQELVDLYFQSIDKEFSKLSKEIQSKINPKRNLKRQVPGYTRKVESLSIELVYLNRYLNLHNKAKTKRQIRLFLNALQRTIIEKKIRKTSPFANEINQLQKDLITLFDKYKTDEIAQVMISKRRQNKLRKVLGKQSEIPSVKLILEYLKLQGKQIPTSNARRLFNKIVRKERAGIINSKDKYKKQIGQILLNLKALIDDNPVGGQLLINTKPLNGISEILRDNAKGNHSLDGFDTIPERTIMNSMDIIKLNFKKLDFKGKWREFIGNPSKGFSAMIFAKPKMGKSYMSVEWAGYLANNHGTVLYVAKEEGIDETLQKKLREKAVMHPDLYVANYLPEDLSIYDFVFLDSITKLKLTPSDLAIMESNYPNISFISIFQVTKSGNFRGNNGFQHEVDVVIEIPEKGKAIQYGRFNQGGEMDIFDDIKE